MEVFPSPVLIVSWTESCITASSALTGRETTPIAEIAKMPRMSLFVPTNVLVFISVNIFSKINLVKKLDVFSSSTAIVAQKNQKTDRIGE